MPHLQAAVSRLKGKPFEIIAISLDDKRDDAARAVNRRKIPGIQTWDPKGWENPIRRLYNVQSMPTWYLIDRRGVIRNRDPLGPDLIPAVKAALAETERPGGDTGQGRSSRKDREP